MKGVIMKQKITLSQTVSENIYAAILCGLLTALVVYLWIESIVWGFLAYSVSGAVFFILFMIIATTRQRRYA